VATNVYRLGKLACNVLGGSRTSRLSGSTGREGEDKDRFARALGSVAGRRLTYDELTDKQAFNWTR
jgi:hypothetical protein